MSHAFRDYHLVGNEKMDAMAKGRLKETLEWLHHFYWIGELLGSLGLGGIITRLVGEYFHLDLEWKLLIWTAVTGLLLMLLHVFLRKFERGDKPQTGGQWLPEAELALTKTEKTFDFQKFWKVAYASPLQPEFERAVVEWLASTPQKEREATLVKFIGSGLVAYMHDTTWWMIFKSQLLALDELNKRVMRREDLKASFYDQAAEQYPAEFKNDTFDRWLSFMKDKVLILELPGDTVGITERGKDFLKHVLHYGYRIDFKRL
jgi:hypothetical protein